MGESVLEVLPDALDADVALRAGQHRLHLVLELGGHLELGLAVVHVVLHERLDRANLHSAAFDIAPEIITSLVNLDAKFKQYTTDGLSAGLPGLPTK